MSNSSIDELQLDQEADDAFSFPTGIAAGETFDQLSADPETRMQIDDLLSALEIFAHEDNAWHYER